MRHTGRFPRSARLLRASDFQRVGRSSVRNASRYFVVLAGDALLAGAIQVGAKSLHGMSGAFGGESTSRLGITVSRKVGGAVVRNRIKRSVREWFRRERNDWPGALDVVVIARSDAVSLVGSEIARTLSKQVRLAVDTSGKQAVQ